MKLKKLFFFVKKGRDLVNACSGCVQTITKRNIIILFSLRKSRMVQKQYKQSIISLKLNFFIGYNTYIFEIILLKSQF